MVICVKYFTSETNITLSILEYKPNKNIEKDPKIRMTDKWKPIRQCIDALNKW